MFDHGIWFDFIFRSYWRGLNYYSTWEHTTKCSNVGADVSGHVESKLNSTCQLFRVLHDCTKGLQHESAVISLKSLQISALVLSCIHVSYFLTYVLPRVSFPEFKLSVLSTPEMYFYVTKIYNFIVLRKCSDRNKPINKLLKKYSFLTGVFFLYIFESFYELFWYLHVGRFVTLVGLFSLIIAFLLRTRNQRCDEERKGSHP